MPRIDLINKVFGELTVINFSHGGKNANWLCKCSCGNETIVTACNLKNGNTTRCNNITHKKGRGIDNIYGKTFGRLTAISVISKSDGKQIRTFWDCVCSCGNKIQVESGNLKSGHTQSCGCYFVDKVTTHGCASENKRLYGIWRGMMDRCYKPSSISYKFYGNKGITVYPEWHDVKVFFKWAINNGYKDDLTIERKIVYEGYNPDNCIWIKLEMQARNTTVSLGEKKVLEIREKLNNGSKPKELANEYKVAYTTIIAIKNFENYKVI